MQKQGGLSRVGFLAMLCIALAVISSTALAQETPERPKPADYDQWREALEGGAATPTTAIETLPGYEVELLRSARPGEGSWVSMAFDPEGRLTIGREDRGLLRLIIPDLPIDPRHEPARPPVPPEETGEVSPQEQLPPVPYDPFHLRTVEDTLLECRGLLYAYDALYANANNSKGFYRLRDRDDDGTFEEVTLLRKTPGSVGHGRNDLTLGPDGLIYLIHGNDVLLPEDYDPVNSPLRDYDVDRLLPCEWNKYLFNAGATVPGGHVVRTDAEGKMWELVAGGFRNAYGVAFNGDGELFTYDADMEWDAGAPWYRPTRVNHVVSGADFGWRQGTGKWEAWYPDGWPSTLDIGLGSPTAVIFGTKSNFPQRYRDALYILDWAYGRIIAVHLSPDGASYAAEKETFVKGRPLNVTDVAFGPDGHLYFITGGRKTQSGLYRIRYTGTASEQDENTPQESGDESNTARAERKRLEQFHGGPHADAVKVAWDYLDSDDVWLRNAARVAIEAQPTEEWSAKALAEDRPTAALTTLMALARVGEKSQQAKVLARLAEFPLDKLTPEQRIIALRAWQLAFIRLGPPDKNATQHALAQLEPHYPTGDYRADHYLSELLVYLNSPVVIARTLPLIELERPAAEKLHFIFALRHVKDGWTLDQRKTYFHWLRLARGFPGAQYVPRFAHYIEQDALASLTESERDAVTPILNAPLDEPAPLTTLKDRPIVKEWKLIDFLFALDDPKVKHNVERGKEMFAAAQCLRCHRMGATGGQVGPDLTGVAQRFNRRDVLVSILSPSKVIDDKYKATLVVTSDGKSITGQVVEENDDELKLMVDQLMPDKLVSVKKRDIESRSISPISPMPEGLLNTLTQEEVLDLLAYIQEQAKNLPAIDPK